MLSAVIFSIFSYPTLRLAPQLVHQWYVHPGPLVLGTNPLNSSTPQQAKKDAMQLAQDDDWNSFDNTEVYGVKWVKAQKKKKKKK